jgi:predicted nucleotidyltransferase
MADIPAPIAALLPELVDDLRSTLGDDLVGVYVYGSAITGGFDPETSDLDLLIVTETDGATIDLETLDGVHERLSEREPDWADRLDLAYVGRATLASFRSGGVVVSISHDDPLQRYDEAQDWLQTWYLVQLADTPVVGPRVPDVVPPIAPEEFVRAVVRSTLELADKALADERDGWRAYALLTLCRVLVTMETGTLVSKQDAAATIGHEIPEAQPSIDAALKFRMGRGRKPLSPDARAAMPASIGRLAGLVRQRAARR